MEKATISELKNRLSAYLKKVRAGHTILIFDRDQPVARLERVAAGGEAHDRLARLERAGLLRRATRPVDAKALRAAPARSATRGIVEALIAERSEAR
jgi:prevent-host-death family protein